MPNSTRLPRPSPLAAQQGQHTSPCWRSTSLPPTRSRKASACVAGPLFRSITAINHRAPMSGESAVNNGVRPHIRYYYCRTLTKRKIAITSCRSPPRPRASASAGRRRGVPSSSGRWRSRCRRRRRRRRRPGNECCPSCRRTWRRQSA